MYNYYNLQLNAGDLLSDVPVVRWRTERRAPIHWFQVGPQSRVVLFTRMPFPPLTLSNTGSCIKLPFSIPSIWPLILSSSIVVSNHNSKVLAHLVNLPMLFILKYSYYLEIVSIKCWIRIMFISCIFIHKGCQVFCNWKILILLLLISYFKFVHCDS